MGEQTKRVKILNILGALGVGGCEMQLLELCRRMDKTRFDLSVCWYSATPDALAAEFNAAGVRTLFFDKFSMPLWQFFAALRRTIRSEAPDIVHTWLYSANFWGRWAAVSCGMPRIVASYRNEVREANLLMRLTEKLLSSQSIVLANSAAVVQSLAKHYGVTQQRVRIIYNAISLPACDKETARRDIRAELGLPAGQNIVLMVARQHQQKNYPLFIRTARQVCRQRQDVTFVAVGRGDMQGALDRLVAEHGVPGRVLFVGLKKDVHRWLAAADVFCFTSDYEGFPNAVLEAMLAGLPVVCTSFAGIDEIITDAQTGIIVPLNDERAMAREVATVLDNPDIGSALGAAACRMVHEKFNWDALTVQMQDFYCSL